MVTYLVPIVAMTAGAVYRGERFGPSVLLGACALIGGVWLAQQQGGAARVERELARRASDSH
jgi:drug/metabolite transporter (DMT)-like permease